MRRPIDPAASWLRSSLSSGPGRSRRCASASPARRGSRNKQGLQVFCHAGSALGERRPRLFAAAINGSPRSIVQRPAIGEAVSARPTFTGSGRDPIVGSHPGGIAHEFFPPLHDGFQPSFTQSDVEPPTEALAEKFTPCVAREVSTGRHSLGANLAKEVRRYDPLRS